MLLGRRTISFLVTIFMFPICVHGQPWIQRVAIESTSVDAESWQIVIQPHQSYNVTCEIEIVKFNTTEHDFTILFHQMKRTTQLVVTDIGCNTLSNDIKLCYKKLLVNDSAEDDIVQCRFYIHGAWFFSQSLPVTVERFSDSSNILPTPTMSSQPMMVVTSTPGPSPYDNIPEKSCMCALPTSTQLASNSQIGLNTNIILFILTTLLTFYLNIVPDKNYNILYN